VGDDRLARVGDHLLQGLRGIQNDLLRSRDCQIEPGSTLASELLRWELPLAGSQHLSGRVEDEHEVRLWDETP
jgi:hypothetical protein